MSKTVNFLNIRGEGKGRTNPFFDNVWMHIIRHGVCVFWAGIIALFLNIITTLNNFGHCRCPGLAFLLYNEHSAY